MTGGGRGALLEMRGGTGGMAKRKVPERGGVWTCRAAVGARAKASERELSAAFFRATSSGSLPPPRLPLTPHP